MLGFTIFLACRKDLSEDNLEESSDPFLKTAKEYYYSVANKNGILNVDRLASSKIAVGAKRRITPLWYRGFTGKSGTNLFSEVPIITNNKKVTVYGSHGKDKASDFVRVNSAFQRLLIYQTENGTMHQVQLTYIPDYEYLVHNHYDASKSQITNLDNYSGYVEFSSFDSQEVYFVVRFIDGKFISKKMLTKISSTQITSSAKSANGKIALAVPKDITISFWDEQCTPQYQVLCFEMGDPPKEECMEPEYIGDACEDVWIDDPEPPADPNDCANPENFFMCDPNNPGSNEDPPSQTNPETPGDTDPCKGKNKVKATAKVTKIANALGNLKNTITGNSTNPNNSESGADFKLTGFGQNDGYKDVNITGGSGTIWQPGTFTWNSTDGYKIGEAHTHLDGTAPSPADIMDMAKNLAAVESSGLGIDYYKNNVSTTVVTSYGNYVVTVKDWTGFLSEYNNYHNTTLSAYNASYLQLGGGGNVAPGVRFLLKFGAFLNLYKADPGSDEYKPLKLNQNNAVELTPCQD